MRTLVILFVLGLAAFAGIYWLTMKASEDPGFSFALAFGNPSQDTIEIHVVVYNRTVRIDPPRFEPKAGVELWQEWVDTHFDLHDDAGQKVAFHRAGGSALISGTDLGAGTPEFYLVGKVKKGVRYDFDYLPTPVDGERFRHSFVAPAEAEKLRRPMFKPVTASVR